MSSRSIAAIVAATRDGVIGRDGGLPWHYSDDLKRFKRLTLGGTVIMGRKTWQSIGEKALPGRRNIVISRGAVNGVEHHASVEAAIAASEGAVWIIGGGEIFSAALQYCDFIDLTWVPDQLPAADSVLLPDLDPGQWRAGAETANPHDPALAHQRFDNLHPVAIR